MVVEVGEEEKHHRTTVSWVYELPSPIPLSQTTAPAVVDVVPAVVVDDDDNGSSAVRLV